MKKTVLGFHDILIISLSFSSVFHVLFEVHSVSLKSSFCIFLSGFPFNIVLEKSRFFQALGATFSWCCFEGSMYSDCILGGLSELRAHVEFFCTRQ